MAILMGGAESSLAGKEVAFVIEKSAERERSEERTKRGGR